MKDEYIILIKKWISSEDGQLKYGISTYINQEHMNSDISGHERLQIVKRYHKTSEEYNDFNEKVNEVCLKLEKKKIKEKDIDKILGE